MPHVNRGYRRFDSEGRITCSDDINSPESRFVPKHLRQDGNQFFLAYLDYGMSYEPIAFAVIDQNQNIHSGIFPITLKPIPNAKSKAKVENFLRSFAKNQYSKNSD